MRAWGNVLARATTVLHAAGWLEGGGQEASARATKIWQDILANPKLPKGSAESREEMKKFTEKRTEEGGALPVS